MTWNRLSCSKYLYSEKPNLNGPKNICISPIIMGRNMNLDGPFTFSFMGLSSKLQSNAHNHFLNQYQLRFLLEIGLRLKIAHAGNKEPALQLLDLFPHRMYRLNKARGVPSLWSCTISYTRTQIMCKTTAGRKPKKKIYHRVQDLDRVMDLRKKPSLILHLKSIIHSQKTASLLLRDLEKEVGFVQKWTYMSVIDKYPTIFRVFGGTADGSPPAVTLTEKAKKIAALESEARAQMEPILVRNLRKLLMLSVDCRLPLEAIDSISNELGLPNDFKNSVILRYPDFFRLDEMKGREFLHLENWDSSLAVTARDERLASQGITFMNREAKRVRISKDGNFLGPFAFHLKFPAGFRPNVSYLEELEKWQKMEFPSPYLNARRFEAADPKARKRAVAVLHELLSLTMEKRLTSAQIDAFHSELRLPARLLLCLIKHHGIFYITNKGVKSSVILKEAYDGTTLRDKCPLIEYTDKFMALIGRKECSSRSEIENV